MLGQSERLRLFPRSRLFAVRGYPLKSSRARVFGADPRKRARDAHPGQHIASEKAGTREHREREAAPGRVSSTRGALLNGGVPRTPAPVCGDASFRREDFAPLVYVLETTGHFTPAPPDPPWADPRPDLVADHALWLTLLELAYRRDGADPCGIFGALVGIRCCGAGITSSGGERPTWRLTRGEMTAAEWQAIRTKWLMPHLKVLQELLGTSGAATTEATQIP
jgi:hypothetical protein